MNVCAKKQKLIVELAMEALEPGQARELRAHIENCTGCREYLAEISSLNARLRVVATGTDIEASEAFHQRVMRTVREEEAQPWWGAMASSLRAAQLSWRVAVPALGGVAVVIAALLLLAPRPGAPPPAPVPSQARLSPRLEGELPPSVANYRIAANRSLDQLDELLTQQANRRESARPIYTASVLAMDAKLRD